MRSRSAPYHLSFSLAWGVLALIGCAGSERAPSSQALATASTVHPSVVTPVVSRASTAAAPPVLGDTSVAPAAVADLGVEEVAGSPAAPPAPEPPCAGVPPLGPDGAAPPPPPHDAQGEDLQVPGDRPAYVLPGNPEDTRVILYLHGMCGDVTAPDHFREAARQHGTLLALRADTPCENGRFKWRDGPAKIHERFHAALHQLNLQRGLQLSLEGAILFGYSQGADRAEKLAQFYPQRFRRVVLGGPPMRASPAKLHGAQRVAILGGELETTERMRAGVAALEAANIRCRYFELECAYHGWYGTRAEQQLSEVLAWVSEP